MAGIVLSSSVRQNLFSLQSTADLLATTQSRLSTGKKVNTALDNPTNFFTAQGLDNRSTDISNLLDGISNGVQVIQAANTGLTSLQKLVDSAKSVANQALQAAVGYSTKSNVTTTAIFGATAADIRGTTGPATPATAGTLAAGTFTSINVSGAGSPATAGKNTGGAFTGPVDVSGGDLSFDVVVDGGATQTVTIDTAAVNAYNLANTTTLDDTALTAQNIADLTADQLTGATVALNGGVLEITSGTTGTGSTVAISNYTNAGTGTTGLANGAGTTGQAVVAAQSQSFSITVDGGQAQTVTLSAASVATYNALPANSGSPLDAAALDADDVAALINSQITGAVASVDTGKLLFTSSSTGATSSVATSVVASAGSPTGSTGITAATGTSGAAVIPGSSALDGLTLTIGATGGGVATSITFGTAVGEVKSLNDLNAKLADNNLQATIDSAGKINITTSNDKASAKIGLIGGTAANVGKAFSGLVSNDPVKDAAAQLVRSNLVTQYNNILDQITSTSRDASYNGVNLLNNDALSLTFNETGTSKLKIQGVQFNATGLGLSQLTEFNDNSSATAAIASLSTASSTLRTQASTLGSNLSIVQIRQDFSKNLINVLQTGSSNLTLADTNEEAANSQALSTRQSIAVSALSLANQSQQSVLQLLR